MNIYRGRSNAEVYLASVLYDAIDDRDYSAASTLLTVKNADPNLILPGKGISGFHLAVGCEPADFAFKMTSLILQHGGDPNVQSDDGITPVHIAANWGRTEILKLLLKCGGDPEITDNCYKNAINHALCELHTEAATIIQEFVKEENAAALADYWQKDMPCKLMLDKIVVNNAGLIAEYESAKDATDAIDLKNLPQTNSNDYVLNWCNSQVLYSDESSASSRKSSPQLSPNFSCCYYKEASRESGIVTLSESLTDDKNATVAADDHFRYVLLTTDSDNSVSTSNLEINKKNKDTSSDYYTCTEISEDTNIAEQNIFEISSSASSICSLKSSGQNPNCVSVSEIYKYTDVEEGVVLFEKRLLLPSALTSDDSGGTELTKSSKLSSLPKSFDYDTDSLRKELTNLGYDPGPITKSTKRVYLRKLYHLKNHPNEFEPKEVTRKVYSGELERTLRDSNWADDLTALCKLEAQITQEFSNGANSNRRWREGFNKSSFTYLLLDPRVTKNLPSRADSLSPSEIWQLFVSSIFYVGKGKRSRPYSHLYDAIGHFNNKKETENAKIRQILDIWGDNQGVVCLHVFQNVIPVEAYTREAAMISALKIENLTNLKSGDFYGVATTWSKHQRNLLGVYLLHKAMKIFLNEGERQLSPQDID